MKKYKARMKDGSLYKVNDYKVLNQENIVKLYKRKWLLFWEQINTEYDELINNVEVEAKSKTAEIKEIKELKNE